MKAKSIGLLFGLSAIALLSGCVKADNYATERMMSTEIRQMQTERVAATQPPPTTTPFPRVMRVTDLLLSHGFDCQWPWDTSPRWYCGPSEPNGSLYGNDDYCVEILVKNESLVFYIVEGPDWCNEVKHQVMNISIIANVATIYGIPPGVILAALGTTEELAAFIEATGGVGDLAGWSYDWDSYTSRYEVYTRELTFGEGIVSSGEPNIYAEYGEAMKWLKNTDPNEFWK